MSRVVWLEDAREKALYGSKAVDLGQAIRDGLPVPPGVALSGAIVEAVASGEDVAIEEVLQWVRPLGEPPGIRPAAIPGYPGKALRHPGLAAVRPAAIRRTQS